MQANAAIGGATDDTPMIEIAQSRAAQIAEAFADALSAGQISQQDLFDTDYVPIAGTDPRQVRTRFVHLTDRILPPIQEPVLELDGRIVFCAAVDRNGYLAHGIMRGFPTRSPTIRSGTPPIAGTAASSMTGSV